MSHGPETDALTQRALAFLSGQDWVKDKLSDNDKSAVEMTVMLLVALVSRRDEGLLTAAEAFADLRTWQDMNFFQRLRFTVDRAERIFVRAQVDGKWGSVALPDLSDAELFVALHWLAKRDVEPSRIVE